MASNHIEEKGGGPLERDPYLLLIIILFAIMLIAPWLTETAKRHHACPIMTTYPPRGSERRASIQPSRTLITTTTNQAAMAVHKPP